MVGPVVSLVKQAVVVVLQEDGPSGARRWGRQAGTRGCGKWGSSRAQADWSRYCAAVYAQFTSERLQEVVEVGRQDGVKVLQIKHRAHRSREARGTTLIRRPGPRPYTAPPAAFRYRPPWAARGPPGSLRCLSHEAAPPPARRRTIPQRAPEEAAMSSDQTGKPQPLDTPAPTTDTGAHTSRRTPEP